MEQKKVRLIVVVVAFALLLAGAYVLYDKLSDKISSNPLGTQVQQEDTQQKEQVPDFMVYDRQGNPAKLSDFFGKPIVLNFWASWCGPCKSEMPAFQKLYEEMGDQVQFLMVNATGGRETTATAKAFLNGTGYTFPVLFDTAGNAAITYGVYSLPTTFFIDKDGFGVTQTIGAINEEILRRGIELSMD